MLGRAAVAHGLGELKPVYVHLPTTLGYVDRTKKENGAKIQVPLKIKYLYVI